MKKETMYNFQLLLHNYDFNENDVATLKELSPLAHNTVDDFLILFYKRIFTFEHASHFLSNDTLVQRHRKKIKAWFLRLFNGVYDEAYFEILYRISQIHVHIALPNHYVNAALHVVRSFLRELLITHQRIDALKSVDKLIDMHIDALSGIYNATEQTDILKTIKTLHQSLSKEGKGIIPYVQPIFNTRTLQIDKYECLMRVKDINEIILPFKFLDIAQKAGLYCDLSRFMIGKVFSFFEKREEAFSVNLSFEDIKEYVIKDFLKKRLNTFYNPSRITFEILESQSLDNTKTLEEFIAMVRAHGCQIAIDDFGTGFSNFDHILSLSPNSLKIDGSLIKDIDHNTMHYDIVENIHHLAHKLGIVTVAEYVHSEAVLQKIRSIGIDYAQGFYLGMPQAIETIKCMKNSNID